MNSLLQGRHHLVGGLARQRRHLRTAGLAAAAVLAFAASMTCAAASAVPTVIYAFSTTEGASPNALVRAKNGNLYGATASGGANDLGIVFELTPDGVLTTMHAFNGADGASPNFLLEGHDGQFYGTTTVGGAFNQGTVFKISAAGALTVLHSFSGADGSAPNSLVVGHDGRLFGTTTSGGTAGAGVIFVMTTAGTVSTLYSFSGIDGAMPGGALVEATDGLFYGETSGGGLDGFGTVFRVTATGRLTTMIASGLDIGGEPVGALVKGKDGNFYGVTTAGYGAIYRMTPAGDVTLLYVFNPNTTPGDGAGFQVGLVQESSGDLYGTNTFGGEFGYGALFKITTSGSLLHLRAFLPGSDGAIYGPLVEAPGGQLYAAAAVGGLSGVGLVEEFSRKAVPPTRQFTIAPSAVNLTQGSSATATWQPTDADACTATGAWNGPLGTSNHNAVTLQISLPGTYTYAITCSGGGGTVSKSVAVVVTAS
jgi:uncharacterized repeat protein (TIGR03803 family)